MMTEYFLTAVILMLAILASYYTFHCFRSKQYIKAFTLSTPTILLILLTISILIVSIERSTYQRLTKEHVVASVEFKQTGDKQFEVLLTQSHSSPKKLIILGDQWQIDARIIKWKGLAAKMGLQPLYLLERVSGRYENIETEKSVNKSVFSIQNNELSLWNLLVEYQEYLPWFDAYYGNATYFPMRHEAKFIIKLTSNGLIARPRNLEASQSLAQWLASSQ